jgi:hypothetical protein
VEEGGRIARALDNTSKSLLSARLPAMKESGTPRISKEDEEMSEPEGEAVRASYQQSPASHRGRFSRRPSMSPAKAAALPAFDETTPSLTLQGWGRDSLDTGAGSSKALLTIPTPSSEWTGKRTICREEDLTRIPAA